MLRSYDIETLQFTSKVRCHSLYQRAFELSLKINQDWNNSNKTDIDLLSSLIEDISDDTDLPKFAVAQQISEDVLNSKN